MRLTEEQVQRTVVQWFEAQYPNVARWLHHSPNGGHRHKATAGRLKAMGTRAGFPDLALYVPRGTFQGLAIELKRGKRDKATADQQAWLTRLGESGWYVAVCHGVDEAIMVIRLYMRDLAV